jgi:hypothetical protein
MSTVHLDAPYINGEAVIKRATYPNGSTALLLESTTGESLAVATVALDVLPDDGNVFIKSWSENEGLLDSLQRAGVVGPVIRSVPTGFVSAQEVKVLVPLEGS